jgi:uncharacterized membrane protein YphA (DoxX/SURF4 family)
LLLRAAVGLATIAAGVLYFSGSSNLSWAKWSLGFALIISGAALAIGFLTPFAGIIVGVCSLGIALSWFQAPFRGLHDTKLLASGMTVIAVAIALLGPGAFSLDGRLFGRREIVIPPSSQPPES